MKYLVDADVLSQPTKPVPTPHVVDWLRKHDKNLVVSPIVLGELEYGILLLPAGRKRTALLTWFNTGIKQLNLVEFDASTASAWAQLLAELRRKGSAMPVKDSLIAATARRHQFTVATRNIAHYQDAGVRLVNPFTSR